MRVQLEERVDKVLWWKGGQQSEDDYVITTGPAKGDGSDSGSGEEKDNAQDEK